MWATPSWAWNPLICKRRASAPNSLPTLVQTFRPLGALGNKAHTSTKKHRLRTVLFVVINKSYFRIKILVDICFFVGYTVSWSKLDI